MTQDQIAVDVNLDLLSVREISNRKGLFTLGQYELRNWSVFRLMSLFKHFVILNCRYDPVANRTEYFALSLLFDEVGEGVEAPRYAVSVKFDGRVKADQIV